MINRKQVFDKTHGHCAYCGCVIDFGKFQVDHKWPKAGGGTDDIDNLLPACNSCNNYKSTFHLELFRKQIGRQIEILRRDRPTFRLAERYGLVKCTDKPIAFYFEKLEQKK